MGRKKQAVIGYLSALACWLFLPAFAAHAVTLTVNSTVDAVDASSGNGICAASGGACTLRAAIMEANHLANGPHTIILPAGTYILTRPTAASDNETIGDLDITSSMDIVGAGSSSTIIDGNGSVTNDRVIEISASATVNISGVTVRNGGNPNVNTSGAGILNGGTLSLTSSIITNNNTDAAAGGGIFNSGGIINLIDSTVSNNSALAGGGIVSSGGGAQNFGVLSLTNSTVSGNSTFGRGAGIWNFGPLTIINSTVSGNSIVGGTVGTRVGGGIDHAFGTLTMINSTISGNSAMESGGGIYNESTNGTVDIFNSTVTLNRAGVGTAAGVGGGVYTGASSVTTFQNTILARNRTVTSIGPPPTVDNDDCAGTIDSDGFNLKGISGMSEICTITGIPPLVGDPQLGSLDFNGGPTQTHALAATSPAIDAGDCTLGPKPLTDQRGFPRTVDGDHNGTFRCDIGAYEFGVRPIVTVRSDADFDGDGKADIAIYRDGIWFIIRSSDGVGTSVGWGGLPQDIPVPADYDGDGKSDIAVYRDGVWYIIRSSTGVGTSVGWGGLPQDIPVPADYDGDGKADVAVYRDGIWFIIRSSDGAGTSVGWGGLPQDIPVPADYDGDGKADIAVYRDGVWYIIRSSNGAQMFIGWGGLPQDIPVPADYDGDGKTDVAVYRDGIWYIMRSLDGVQTVTGWGGLSQDIPVSADYDGDGKTDIAVYRDGVWYIIRSSDGGQTFVGWGGLPQDIPLN